MKNLLKVRFNSSITHLKNKTLHKQQQHTYLMNKNGSGNKFIREEASNFPRTAGVNITETTVCHVQQFLKMIDIVKQITRN